MRKACVRTGRAGSTRSVKRESAERKAAAGKEHANIDCAQGGERDGLGILEGVGQRQKRQSTMTGRMGYDKGERGHRE